MLYVPIVPSTPTPPSPRARQLADRLTRVILDFEEKYPTVTKAEVRQATQLAMRATGGDSGQAKFVVLVLLGLVMLGVGGLAVFAESGAIDLSGVQFPVVAVAIFVGILAVMVVAMKNKP